MSKEDIKLENKSEETVLLKDLNPDIVKMYESTIYKCDECEGTFHPSEVVMHSADNIEFAGLLGIRSLTKNNRKYYMHCPHCDQVHLFGFDLAEPQKDKEDGTE